LQRGRGEGEERGNEQAASGKTGQTAQREEKEDGVRRVEQTVDEMMASG